MNKKELWDKIHRQKQERRRNRWLMDNLRELSDYVETGELHWLREKALHAIRALVQIAKAENPKFQLPWFVYCV